MQKWKVLNGELSKNFILWSHELVQEEAAGGPSFQKSLNGSGHSKLLNTNHIYHHQTFEFLLINYGILILGYFKIKNVLFVRAYKCAFLKNFLQ